MADLYRKSSLERLSNPEQLDRMIKISSPMSWLALLGILAVIVVVVVWSIVGTLPSTETVNGMIMDSGSVCAVYSDTQGTLEKYCVEVGDEVAKGDVLAQMKLADGTVKDITAERDGVVGLLFAQPGTALPTGSEIARLTPKDMGSQLVVCYVPLAYAQKFEEGMDVLVYPAAVDSQKYGHMEAEIVCVEKYATNGSSLEYLMGSGNSVAQMFLSNGPVVAVTCKLETDSDTASGFYWTSSSAKDLTVSNGTIVSAKIVVDESAPITKLIGKLKSVLEG